MNWEPKPILETFRTDYNGDIVTINIGDEIIPTTNGHPFWVIAGKDLANRPVCDCLPTCDQEMTQDGRWIYTRDLQVDDVVRSHSFGTQKISALESSLMQTMVYNFLTDDLHNYVVGENGILVHNTNTKFDDIPERISKGRVTPKNEAERIAWEEIHINLKYPYFSIGVWRKIEYKKGNIVIHYVREIFTGTVRDFKFKNP